MRISVSNTRPRAPFHPSLRRAQGPRNGGYSVSRNDRRRQAVRSLSAAALAVGCLTVAQPAGAHTGAAAPSPTSASSNNSAPGSRAFEGRLVSRHGDTFSAVKPRFQYMLKRDDGTQLELEFGDERKPSASPGARVRVKGVRRGDQVAVAADSIETVSGPTVPSAATALTKKVAVVLVKFSKKGPPYTPAYAEGIAFTNPDSVASYYAETSGGGVSLTGDVFGWYTIPDTNATCSYGTWAASANTAAAAAGVDLSAYDNVVYAFPSTSACGWTGLAHMPGRSSWLNGSGGMGLYTMAHELGHNFGTHHASSLSCTESGVRVSLSASSTNCTASEYGDPFSIMGASTRWHTNVALGNFGWLQPANTLDVTSSGDYLLKPIESYDTAAVQSLRIARSSSSYLTLELRQSGLSAFDVFSASDPVVNGVSVRVAAPYTTRSQSKLVDATPSTASFWDGALAVGRTLVDPVTGASITTLGVSPAGAMVRVDLDPPDDGGGTTPAPDSVAPTAPSALTATMSKGKKVALAWSPSSDNVGVSGYRIYRNGSQLTTTSGTSFTDTLSGKPSATYYVVAYDAAGNVSPPSASASI